MTGRKIAALFLIAVALVVVTAACAPGNLRWTPDHRANFWAGLWHGLIVIITFVVSLFTGDVKIYEVNNVGWAYNLGFLLGCMISLGGGARVGTHRHRGRREPDWDKVGRRIGDGVRDGLRSWRAQERKAEEDKDWDELGRRIEERVREELRKSDK